MIHIIVAIDRHGAIGSKGDMLFHIREDLRRFKALTMGHPVIMGRKTFESLPKGALPGRRNIVISRNPHFRAENIEVVPSLDKAIELSSADSVVYIIGGASIYNMALPIAGVLDLTLIDADGKDPDTFFPEIPITDFEISKLEIPDSEPKVKFYTLTKKHK